MRIGPLALCILAGTASPSAYAQQLWQQPPAVPSAYRSYNLAPFAQAIIAGADRRIVAVGDSINSDDSNFRMGQGRARQWDVAWTGWTTPGAASSNWGGYHLSWSPAGSSHLMTGTPYAGVTTVPLSNGEEAVHLRAVDEILFEDNVSDGQVVAASDMPSWSLSSQWKRGDWTVNRPLRSRFIFRNDPVLGAPFDLWSYRGAAIEIVQVDHGAQRGWEVRDLDFGTPSGSYTFHRIIALTRPGINETDGILIIGGAHWYLPSTAGPAYTPLGIAGWRSLDWAATTLIAPEPLQTYLAAARNPNTLLIHLGANDANSQVPASEFKAAIIATIDRFTEAFTANGGDLSDYMVVLVSPYDLGGFRTPLISEYAAALEEIATELPPPLDTRTATLNGFGVHGPWELFRVACLPDGVHPNLTGIDFFAANEWREILNAAQPAAEPLPVLRSGGYSSQTDASSPSLGAYSAVVDDFVVGYACTIESVEFWGTHNESPQGPVPAFTLRVYADAGGQPGALVRERLVTDHVQEAVPTEGPPVYRYTADLGDPLPVSGNTRFWMSIVAEHSGQGGTAPAQWGWLPARTGSGFRAMQSFRTPGEFAPLHLDMAFSLHGAVQTNCFANCDQSTAVPFLNVADFTCFLQRFAGGHPYANCDLSTSPPVLNVADFTCFLQRFAQGCNP